MISSDSVLQGILLKNEAVDDIYSIMAAKIIGKSLETVTKTERDSAKTVTLALLYGMVR